ncbi:sensor histidine kinase [Streptomyces albus subsp. chlorinus]|uniref:sensor histidine kinase n=1 Tax=Streptomyces albus TaxID=1888 RepID=UPI00156EC0D9|nr:sensor histidine kinase [Streptomyces albus]NSC23119.1 sensor histidine kinase [Streptomyces albus subsp. chlorinus]
MRIRPPRRVFSHVLTVQLALVVGVTALVSGLFLAPLSDQLDRQAMRRALAIAQTTAARPGLAEELAAASRPGARRPSPHGPLQAEAERVRRATGAEYVVLLDRRGIRWSHPSPSQVGRHVSTDPREVLEGREVTQIDEGTLGRSARGKAPLRDADGRVVGAVSVGIDYANVRDGLLAAVPGLLTHAGGALAAGAVAAYALARWLRRRTHALAFSDISALLAEREAMLHGLAEGVVALDAAGRVRLVNDEAQRLLGLGPDAIGRPVTEALGGAGRTADVLAGRVSGRDLVTVSGSRVLVANRMPTADGGAVATLRDRTELERLGRELEGTRGLLDALRAQDHEHANRLHTLLGLLELELYDEAARFVTDTLGVRRATAEEVTERVGDPLLAALLVGKAAVAAERGVALRIAPDSRLPDRLVDPGGLVTVVGNLVDNALDAAAGGTDPAVEVALRAEGRTVVLLVRDSGPGVPPERRELVFEEGWSTKRSDAADGSPGVGHHGLGLALVRRFAERVGGSVRLGTAAHWSGAEFRVVLPEALGEPADAAVVGGLAGPGGPSGAEDLTGKEANW